MAAAAGLACAAWVIGYFNLNSVLAAIRPIGPGGFALVIVAQLVLFIPLGLAWWLVSPRAAARAPGFVWGRLMREAASDALPFSQLGGVVIATRVAVLAGATMAEALGSCVVDITCEMVAQMIYTLIGLALLAHRLGVDARAGRLLAPMLVGLVLVAVMVGGFVLTQRRGLKLIEMLAQRLSPEAGRQAGAVTSVIEAAQRRPAMLWACLALHVGCWFGAAGGTWLILRFIDHPLPFFSVVAIESLLFAIRNAAFVAPSGLGVQEGAYALIGPLFGLPAEAALALSLLKRARDLTIAAPLLVSWQIAEARRRAAGRLQAAERA